MISTQTKFNIIQIASLITALLSLMGIAYILYSKPFSSTPCTALAQLNCPDLSGWKLYDCLHKVDRLKLSDDCGRFLKLHRSCRYDINKHCNDRQMTGSLERCLNNVQNVTKPCLLDLQPLWKQNKHIDRYQQRRIEDRKYYQTHVVKTRLERNEEL